jgi:uncharacterized protein (TIGR02145 family)
LYNWYAVDDSRNIAPVGWHVPTDEEWQTLVDYLGGHAVAGGKMKEAGTSHWQSPNVGATNESRFTALAAAYRGSDGGFRGLGSDADFWSATEEEGSSYNVWARTLDYDGSAVHWHTFGKQWGFSVRCVRDN